MDISAKANWLASQVVYSGTISLGGFGDALMYAYSKADGSNRRRIEEAFKHLIEREFEMWHGRVD